MPELCARVATGDAAVLVAHKCLVVFLGVEACLRFFGVASPEEWHSLYGGMEVSFRRSREDQCGVGAISAWLRLGEQRAEQFDGPKYDRDKFQKALVQIRAVSTEERPAIPRSHVSGVACWLSASRPLIQMSLYGKWNDRFWFTFFLEAAHILLHANEKKSVYLDDPGKGGSDDPKEAEANQWAGDFLIPDQHAHHLSSLKTRHSVKAFAGILGIHPGIVLGRLQHDGLIEIKWMNDLKVRFQFSTES